MSKGFLHTLTSGARLAIRKADRIFLAWAEAPPQPVSGMDSKQARNCRVCQYRAALSYFRFVVGVQFLANCCEDSVPELGDWRPGRI
jgi:hypothetical protein